MKSVCFTGHRRIPETAAIEHRIQEELELLIAEGYTDFYAGGALGFDMQCELAVILLRERKYPHIRLHLVLPCAPYEQCADWTEDEDNVQLAILTMADSTELVSEHYYNGCMKARNQRLVELADLCLCYCRPNRIRSGTAQTVRMAQRKGIRVRNLAVEE